MAAQPSVGDLLRNLLIPSPEILTNPAMLYVAIGIIGATVMPHNLYLHSSIVQTRDYAKTPSGKRDAIKWATINSTTALAVRERSDPDRRGGRLPRQPSTRP